MGITATLWPRRSLGTQAVARAFKRARGGGPGERDEQVSAKRDDLHLRSARFNCYTGGRGRRAIPLLKLSLKLASKRRMPQLPIGFGRRAKPFE